MRFQKTVLCPFYALFLLLVARLSDKDIIASFEHDNVSVVENIDLLATGCRNGPLYNRHTNASLLGV